VFSKSLPLTTKDPAISLGLSFCMNFVLFALVELKNQTMHVMISSIQNKETIGRHQHGLEQMDAQEQCKRSFV
jgi:hypothetical protein